MSAAGCGTQTEGGKQKCRKDSAGSVSPLFGEKRMTEEMTIIGEEAYRAAKELLEAAKPERGDLFVVGCSTSEVAGAGIGTFSSPRSYSGEGSSSEVRL